MFPKADIHLPVVGWDEIPAYALGADYFPGIGNTSIISTASPGKMAKLG